jgi:hypothetical protein
VGRVAHTPTAAPRRFGEKIAHDKVRGSKLLGGRLVNDTHNNRGEMAGRVCDGSGGCCVAMRIMMRVISKSAHRVRHKRPYHPLQEVTNTADILARVPRADKLK